MSSEIELKKTNKTKKTKKVKKDTTDTKDTKNKKGAEGDSVPQYILGIDLGTTNSCVAVWRQGQIDIIQNDQGLRTTPSYVAFTETERLVGFSAKEQCNLNPKNTIFDTKRLIGRRFEDAAIQPDLSHFPFTVVNNADSRLVIQVRHGEIKEEFYPEQISAMILSHLKSMAEDYLGCPVNRAVIAVPAYFNDSQRQATKDAAEIAGLDCLRIINEPTAAALSYGFDRRSDKPRNILVFDLGGGTFDVSLLTLEGGVFEVLTTSGDTHLGGSDFDHRLVNYACQEFERIHGRSIAHDTKARRKLLSACEKVKIGLSNSLKSYINVDALYQGIDFQLPITRHKFEELCNDLFVRCMQILGGVLEDAKVNREQIDEIVLVGGSTRIPRIQTMLREYFRGKELNKMIHPDEAVAYGAAIHGAVIGHIEDTKVADLVLIDVTPLSLGVETAGGVMSNIIDRNTPIPCTRKEVYTTYVDNQKAVTINIYEGERPLTRFNNLLGTFDLVDLPSCPKGVPHIEVTFDINSNGILTVSAVHLTGSARNQVRIVNNKGRLTQHEIDKLVENARKYREEDREFKVILNAKNNLDSVLNRSEIRLAGEEIVKNISSEEKNRLDRLMTTVRDHLLSTSHLTIPQYTELSQTLERHVNNVVTRIYSGVQIDSSKPT